MKKINKHLNLSMNFIENLYKLNELIKMNMNLYVRFLLNIWTKEKLNIFYKYEPKSKIKSIK